MAGDTTFTFIDADGATQTARSGSDGSGYLSPAATLYDDNAAVLKGQKARAASLPTALSTEDAALLATLLSEATFGAVDFATSAKQDALATLIGAVNETAPANDTASAGLNGRLQRIAQRLTSLLPASIGQKAKAASLAVTLASDEDLLARIGEVQASPTANTLLDRLKTIATALGGTLSVSGTVGVSGNVEVTNDVGNPLPVSGPLTDTQLRATAVSIRPAAIAFSSSDIHAPAANTAAIVTYGAAGAGIAHVIRGISWSYSGTPTGGNLKIEDGVGNTVFTQDITAAGAGFADFDPGGKGTANTALTITLAAGGSGVSGKVSVRGHRTE